MKKYIIVLFTVVPSIIFGQLGVSFHQSNLPFIGINYQIKNKIRPELRIGIDNYIEIISVEAVVTYDLIKKDDYEFYAGLGIRGNDFEGLVIPVGLNIYPLTIKQFGFHIEIAPIFGEGTLVRGSWGIRYRFPKKKR